MKQLPRALILLLLPLALGAAAYALTQGYYRLGPVAELPDVIEFGVQDQNADLATSLSVKNVGWQPLRLDHFSTSCPLCIFVGRTTDSVFVPATDYTLQRGESLELTARVGIGGEPGRPFHGRIGFRTTDPRRPEVVIRLEATIRGRIVALPPELGVGTVAKGQEERRTIKLHDLGRGTPCRISRVESSDTHLIRVSEFRAGLPSPESDNTTALADLGEFDVVVLAPATPGQFNSYVRVFEEGRAEPIVNIPVRWRVPAEYEIVPSAIALPRSVGTRLDYSVTCECRSLNGRPVRVDVESVPDKVTVTPLDSPDEKDTVKRFTVRWEPQSGPTPGGMRREKIRMRVTTGDVAEVVELPVVCWQP